MWPSKQNKTPPIKSLVGEGVVITGELRFIDGLRIDGEVHGDVVAGEGGRSIVVISENARVYGKVKADHVIINGEVKGPVECDEQLELQPRRHASTGDVRYEMLEMHPGAQVEGELRHDEEHLDKPQLKLAASNEV